GQGKGQILKNTAFSAFPRSQRPVIPLHERFDGNYQWFRGFINQCHLLFLMHPRIYASDQSKVALVISLMTGDALDWVSRLLEGHSPVLLNWDAFVQPSSIWEQQIILWMQLKLRPYRFPCNTRPHQT
uniref:DUF4939 domain-containing protein n=1 Tax=Chelydra serpentina TaxID=8475 RepID=A0A8C3T1G8_CHESE